MNITVTRRKQFRTRVRGRSSSRSPQNQENRAKASDNVRKMVESDDFYRAAKTVGFAIVGELTFANPQRWSGRLPFSSTERIRQHLEDLILVECNLVRRRVWADPVSVPESERQRSTGGEMPLTTIKSTDRGVNGIASPCLAETVQLCTNKPRG